MSQLTHHQLPLVRTRIRAALVAGAIALVIAAAAIAIAIGGSDGGSTVSEENVRQAPALDGWAQGVHAGSDQPLRYDGWAQGALAGSHQPLRRATEGAALRSDGGPEEGTRGLIGGR